MHSEGGFFERLPAPPEPAAQPPMPPWWQPPPGELPGRLVLDEVLHHDRRLVVVLSELRRFSNGLEVRFDWVMRRGELSRLEWEGLLMRRVHEPPGYADGALRIGMLLGDGTAVFPLGFTRGDPTTDPAPPTLTANHTGGGGDEHEYRGGYACWVWAPDGPPVSAQLVLEWRDLAMPESRWLLDASLLESIPPARPLWPDRD